MASFPRYWNTSNHKPFFIVDAVLLVKVNNYINLHSKKKKKGFLQGTVNTVVNKPVLQTPPLTPEGRRHSPRKQTRPSVLTVPTSQGPHSQHPEKATQNFKEQASHCLNFILASTNGFQDVSTEHEVGMNAFFLPSLLVASKLLDSCKKRKALCFWRIIHVYSYLQTSHLLLAIYSQKMKDV